MNRYYCDDGDDRMTRWSKGSWVWYDDAQKEIEAAYKRGIQEGLDQAKRAEKYWSKH